MLTIRNTLIKYYIHRKSKVKFETKKLSPRLNSLSPYNASRNENRSIFWLLKNEINVLCDRGESTIETCELREYKTTSLKQICAQTKLNPLEKSLF